MTLVRETDRTIDVGGEKRHSYDEGLDETYGISTEEGGSDSSCLTTKCNTSTYVSQKRRPPKKRSRRNSDLWLHQQEQQLQQEQYLQNFSKKNMSFLHRHNLQSTNDNGDVTCDEINAEGIPNPTMPPPLTRVEAKYYLTLPEHRLLFNSRHFFPLNRASCERWKDTMSTREKEGVYKVHDKTIENRTSPCSPLVYQDQFRRKNTVCTDVCSTKTSKRNREKPDRTNTVRSVMEQIQQMASTKGIVQSEPQTIKEKAVTIEMNQSEHFLFGKENLSGETGRLWEYTRQQHQPSTLLPTSPQNVNMNRTYGSRYSRDITPTTKHRSVSPSAHFSKAMNQEEIVLTKVISTSPIVSRKSYVARFRVTQDTTNPPHSLSSLSDLSPRAPPSCVQRNAMAVGYHPAMPIQEENWKTRMTAHDMTSLDSINARYKRLVYEDAPTPKPVLEQLNDLSNSKMLNDKEKVDEARKLIYFPKN